MTYHVALHFGKKCWRISYKWKCNVATSSHFFCNSFTFLCVLCYLHSWEICGYLLAANLLIIISQYFPVTWFIILIINFKPHLFEASLEEIKSNYSLYNRQYFTNIFLVNNTFWAGDSLESDHALCCMIHIFPK